MESSFISKNTEVDGVTLEVNNDGQLQIKGGAVSNDLLDDTAKMKVLGVNNTSISAGESKSVSIEGGKVTSFVLILARLAGTNYANPGENRSISYKFSKIYDSVTTDLFSSVAFNKAQTSSSGAYIATAGSDSTCYLYSPTEDEKTNGFDVQVSLSGNAGYCSEFSVIGF